MSLKDMRDELRKIRKETVKPVSRMRKADIASELEKLRGKREETPPVASTLGAKPKKAEAKISDVMVAKEKEFPIKPAEEKAKKRGKKPSGLAAKTSEPAAKSTKKELLMKMLAEMSDSE